MKKRLLIRNRRGVARRGVGFSLFVLLGISTLLGFATQIASPQIAQADSAADQDLRRRQLHTFAQCLTKQVFNEKNHKIKVYNDIFDTLPVDNFPIPLNVLESIVVGLDRKQENGIMTCEGAIKQGVLAYKPADINKSGSDDENVHNWILKRLTGEDFSGNTTKKEIDAKGIEDRLNALRREVEKKENAIPGPSSILQQERYFPLAKICYTAKAKRDTNRKLSNDMKAFYMEGIGYFYLRTNNEIKSDIKEFVGKGGAIDRKIDNAQIGDLSLGFRLEGPAENFEATKSDFYPIGSDIKKTITGDHDRGGIVDCGFIFENRDIALNGIKPGENGRLIPPEGVKDSGNGGAGVEKTESKNLQCIVNPPLSWILCPIVTATVSAVGWLQDRVIDALKVPPLTTNGAFADLHKTWASFRDLANALLILIFLITIFAQVLPFDVDPYMVKKVLPKLIAAAICIQFSYFFVQILFDISRVLGAGIEGMINSIKSASMEGGLFGTDILGTGSQDTTATSTFGFGLALAGTGAGIAAVSSVGWALVVPVLLLLLSALISILTLFLTLQIRMVIIIMFTIIAPLAFLAWILPNTEKYFKSWATGLIKLLMMYPLIVFMVSSSALITRISGNAVGAMSGSDEGVILLFQILVSFIPVIIFFMIPMTFKWAGGIFASISGAVQGQGQKLSRRARSGALMKNAMQDAKNKAGTKLMDTHGQKGFGRLGARVASGNAFSFGDSGKRKLKASQEAAMHAIEESIQDSHRGKSNKDLLHEMDALKKTGKIAQAAAIGNLIMSQGGGLEMTKYFEGLEYDMVQSKDAYGNLEFTTDSDGNRVPKMVAEKKASSVVKRDATGAVRKVDDEIWNHVAKKNGAALAVAAPHSIGKPISQASPQALISAKGHAPAREFEAEVKQLHQDLSSSDKETVDKAEKQLRQIASRFIQTAQQDNAGEMQPAMVEAWQNISGILAATGVTVNRVDPATGLPAAQGIADFIEDRTKNDTLEKFVQGT